MIFALLAATAALPLPLRLPPTALAQLSEIQPGARVRVQAPGIVAGSFVGTVLQRTADTVRLGAPNALPIDVPVSRISSFEISRGNSRSLGAVVGTLWGAGIGLVLGAITAADAYYSDGGTYIVASTISGGVWGAGIGALVGKERWDAFDLGARSTMTIVPSRGRVGVAIAF
jgi:hypothetical protein